MQALFDKRSDLAGRLELEFNCPGPKTGAALRGQIDALYFRIREKRDALMRVTTELVRALGECAKLALPHGTEHWNQ
jgi:hypothetical protein